MFPIVHSTGIFRVVESQFLHSREKNEVWRETQEEVDRLPSVGRDFELAPTVGVTDNRLKEGFVQLDYPKRRHLNVDHDVN